MWPFSKKPSQAAPLPSTVVEAAFAAFFGGGAKYALCYANLNGYLAGTTMENQPAFMAAILSEPAFSDAGRAYCAAKLCADTDVLCRAPQLALAAPFANFNQHPDLRQSLEVFRAAVVAEGSQQVYERAGFDPVAWLSSRAVLLRQSDLTRIGAVLDERKLYLQPLLLRARAKGKTAYGDHDPTEARKEVRKFMEHFFPGDSLAFFNVYLPVLYAEAYTNAWLTEAADIQAMPSNGIDFEHWCAAQLEAQGWAVRISQASGDQGVDIEAMRPGFTVAIQCKRYAEPIGNKAIQEAYAGKVHYKSDRACVIGTGGFTRSARELAQSTGVLLLEAENINSFSQLVSADG